MPLLGADFVRDLYREHDAGKSALRDILRHEDLALDDVRVLPLISDVEIATEHALSCGTLISHLQVLTDAERDQMRDRLLACRARGTHWTAISTRDRPVR